MDAPLSSPSLKASQQRGYFASTSSSSSASATQQAPPPQQQQTRSNETSPFLRDFNLVAEAAKRAQMACLMRDMEAVGL